MRILLLGPFPPPHGGVQTNLVAIRNYVRGHGIGCAVVNLTRFRRADVDEVYFPRSAFGVMRLLLTLRYDILHVHHGGNITPRLLGLWLVCTLIPRRKTVITFHSGGYASSAAGRASGARTLRAWILRRFDMLIVVNPEMEGLFRRMRVLDERIRLICPYAVDAEAPSAELPEPLHRFFESHQPVCLTVGLLEPEYDLELQIDVLGRLREAHPNAGLVIAGSGSLEPELRDYIAARPYARDVLLYGDMPHAITLRAIAECSVFLRTTLYDGDSVAVREALHLGTRVIATDNGMRPGGVTLVPPHNTDALIEAIGGALSAGGSVAPAGESGQENLEAVLTVYRRLMA
jgi:glycogen(starch) synthase